MPLTFAHPAIVLPFNYLRKYRLSLTGLITGSVAPDFEYFIRMKVLSIYSHTWLGLFWFDLPMAFVLTYVYHYVVRDIFINNLPSLFYDRLSVYKGFDWNKYSIQNLAIVITSIVIGAASHLFWDSFTHYNGFFVTLWNMRISVMFIGVQIPLYKVIQHFSTLFGTIVIAIAIFKLPAYNNLPQKSSRVYQLSVVIVALIIVMIRMMLGLSIAQYPDLIVTILSGFIIGLITVPAAMYVSGKKSFM